jgi:flagellar hook-associated protein 2
MSAGDVSPIDVASIVQGLMMREQMTLNRLEKSEKNQEVQLSAYGQLQSLLQTFQNNLSALNTTFNGIAYQVTSSNTSAVTATVTSNFVAPVSHTLNVTQLAQAESQMSAAQSSNNTALGMTDSLSLTVGTNSFSVNVSATDSLQNIRDNINNAAGNNGVTASILSTTSTGGQPQYQLVISSNQTGVVNAVSIGDSSGAFNFTEQTKALDAQFTFDGQAVDRASNTVTDVLDGLSFNLLTANTGIVTLNVSSMDPAQQNTNVLTSVQTLLGSYNDVLSFIDKMQINPATRNDTFPSIKTQLENMMNATFTGGGPYHTLADIGIVPKQGVEQTAMISIIDKDGKETSKEVKYTSTGQLMLSTDVPNIGQYLPSLTDALSNNFAAVQSFLTNAQSGILTLMNSNIDPVSGQMGQSIKSSINDVTQDEQVYKQKITDESVRLDKVQAFLTSKYASLNVLLEKLQETNDYLTKQLAMINDESKYSK